MHEVIDHIKVDGALITEKKNLSNKFNEYFVKIGETLAGAITKTDELQDHSAYLLNPSINSFAWIMTDAAEIKNVTGKNSNTHSAGYDSLSVHIVKLSIDKIAEPLSWIINSSLTTGCVPDDLKIAKVCPIFKGGNSSEMTNYQPISILPTFSKILEKVAFNRLHSFFRSQNSLTCNQYGFRPHHSTSMALLVICEKKVVLLIIVKIV